MKSECKLFRAINGHCGGIAFKNVLILFLLTFILVATSNAQDNISSSFYPTWKLLSKDAKLLFVAGYLQGWKDAEKVTDIALDYAKSNPSKAVEGLERIKGLYDVDSLTPNKVVQALEVYYSQIENQKNTLSSALSSVRSSLGGG